MNIGDVLMADSAFELAGASAGTLALALLVLALIDSTSIGTLVIPVWLLLSPGRVRVSRMLVYLGTIAGFYFAVGTVLALGAHVLLERAQDAFDVDGETLLRLVIGVLMLVGCGFIVARTRRSRDDETAEPGEGARSAAPGRLQRWRSRAMGVAEDGTAQGGSEEQPGTAGGAATRVTTMPLIWMALAAGALEVATMLPYIGAIGLVTAEGPGWPLNGAVLAGYCIVMILPALILTYLRVLAHSRVERLLRRIEGWFTRNTGDMAWLLGILGAMLTIGAVQDLGWF
ncbi:GAP family protein [Phytoactinopolyspora endophytica]|uniref:GAP family protein n=1 Tax=Phytoactinopolyspora endophytica TaxID=1642495 RepID=UPI0013EB696C|nr:GAP family protein [Phytoactinopolyspora endophytica]